MKLAEYLSQHRDAIIDQWLDRIVEAYPDRTAQFLKTERDRFRNPVGHALKVQLPILFAALLGEDVGDKLDGAVDAIVRVRSVQDMTASQAATFVYLLKNVVREAVHDSLSPEDTIEELLDFESRIDGLALAAFDNIVACKEKIFEIRAMEAKLRTAKLVDRINRIYEEAEPPEPDRESGA
jgi:hypothetical protein